MGYVLSRDTVSALCTDDNLASPVCVGSCCVMLSVSVMTLMSAVGQVVCFALPVVSWLAPKVIFLIYILTTIPPKRKRF